MECYLNPFEPYFEHSSKWTNLVFQLRISPPAKKRYWLCGKIPTVFGCAVMISTVGSHQVRVCFINSSRLSLASVAWMKPLRIQYLYRCFTCHKLTFCQHASKSMDARRKTLNCTKATWNAFYTCGSLAVSRFPIRVSYKTTLRAKEWGWQNCLHVLSFPKGHVWICPFMSQTVILRLFSTNF